MFEDSAHIAQQTASLSYKSRSVGAILAGTIHMHSVGRKQNFSIELCYTLSNHRTLWVYELDKGKGKARPRAVHEDSEGE